MSSYISTPYFCQAGFMGYDSFFCFLIISRGMHSSMYVMYVWCVSKTWMAWWNVYLRRKRRIREQGARTYTDHIKWRRLTVKSVEWRWRPPNSSPTTAANTAQWTRSRSGYELGWVGSWRTLRIQSPKAWGGRFQGSDPRSTVLHLPPLPPNERQNVCLLRDATRTNEALKPEMLFSVVI